MYVFNKADTVLALAFFIFVVKVVRHINKDTAFLGRKSIEMTLLCKKLQFYRILKLFSPKKLAKKLALLTQKYFFHSENGSYVTLL
jgi:hypothetical protein